MMVATKATAPMLAAPSSEHQQHAESITPEPPMCGLCGTLEDLYFVTDGALCLGCIASVVSVAASDLWPDLIAYSRELEKVLIYG